MRILSSVLVLLSALGAWSQGTFPVNGPLDEREGLYAFTGATIHLTSSTTIENATLVIRGGKIEAVGNNVSIPAGAVEVNIEGKHIYPSFIDLYSSYGLPKQKRSSGPQGRPALQYESKRDGSFGWNDAIKADYNAADEFEPDTSLVSRLRKAGFGAVLTHRADGITRGTGALVLLGEEKPNELILNGRATAHYSFRKGTSKQNYPSSLMGSIALLRQTLYDADWYAQGKDEDFNLSLEAVVKLRELPAVFEVEDKLTVLRADKLGDEFNIQFIVKGNGDEYQRLEEIKAANVPLIVPLKFPLPYDVADPYDAAVINLSSLLHWEWAPMNAALIDSAEIQFAITSADLKSKGEFLRNLRKAVDYGLAKESALRALTETPAELLNESQIGTLEPGKVANFFIASNDIFDDKAFIHENWVSGKKHAIVDLRQPDIRGKYELSVDRQSDISFEVSGSAARPVFKLSKTDTSKVKISGEQKLDQVTISLEDDGSYTRLSGVIAGDSWSGRGQNADGSWIAWSALRVSQYADTSSRPKRNHKPVGNVPRPFGAYGWTEKPREQTYLVRNATVWTNEPAGIVEETDVLVENGKVSVIGQDLRLPGDAVVIDGRGKHLTSGIIDEHAHIAISRGVNEGTQASSAEVRIGDVVNSEDINIYRQLAGGVTAMQQLHGSANPIGGQSAIIKLRWGSAPEEMKIKGADNFIKFALGENVKQSNWGDQHRVRYPQTRMGVEQVYYDHFTRALEYDRNPSKRTDLELEALAEIINKERFVTCHSYQQGEINMLMHVADSFGFNINTFTHILEGYKVADKMKAHGAGGSSFSDWWAYKYEVIYAIPYNAAIMDKVGVVTAINSDDAEMARRLNQEAAKSVKYGGISEENAWKMVTLNPAKLLHLDDRMGSIKVGKDADLVLWSDNPLSVYAKTEMTMVDGVVMYELKKDAELRDMITKERMRLIGLMLDAKKKGGRTQKPKADHPKEYHCDDVHDEG